MKTCFVGTSGRRCGVWRLAFLVSLGILLGTGAVSRAQPPPAGSSQAKAIGLFRQANPQLYLGNYAKAIALYKRALGLMPKLAGAWRNMGLAYEGQKAWNQAIGAYQRYIKLAGSGGKYYLAAQKRINVCRSKLGLAPITFSMVGSPGKLNIQANVTGAVVSLDGVRRGSTPTKPLPVNAGLHVVKVTKVGYLEWSRSVGVKSGQQIVVRVELKKDPHYVPPRRLQGIRHTKAKNEAYLTVRTAAPGVRLYADGVQLQKNAEGVFVLASPGKHVLEVRAPGRLTWRARAVLLRGEKKTLQPVLPLARTKKAFNRWGWVTLGVAGVLAGVGAVFSGLENATYEDVRDRRADTRAELDDLVSKGKVYRNAALGLYAGAAAVLVSSIVLFVYERRGEQPAGRPLPLVVGPAGGRGGLAISYSGELDF
jgi:PEGA domain/TPR repeat